MIRTLKQKLEEETKRRAIYSREVQGKIGSPYRILEYIELRMKGKSEQEALKIVGKKG